MCIHFSVWLTTNSHQPQAERLPQSPSIAAPTTNRLQLGESWVSMTVSLKIITGKLSDLLVSHLLQM